MKNYKTLFASSGMLILAACNSSTSNQGAVANPSQTAMYNAQMANQKAQIAAAQAAKLQLQQTQAQVQKDKDAAAKKAAAPADRTCLPPDVMKDQDKLSLVDLKNLSGDYQLDEVHVYLSTDTPAANAGALYARMRTSGNDPTDSRAVTLEVACKEYKDTTQVNTTVRLAELVHAPSARVTLHDQDLSSGLDDENTNYPTVANLYVDSSGQKSFKNELMDAPFEKMHLDTLLRDNGGQITTRSDGQAGFQVIYADQTDVKNNNNTFKVNEQVLISYKPIATK